MSLCQSQVEMSILQVSPLSGGFRRKILKPANQLSSDWIWIWVSRACTCSPNDATFALEHHQRSLPVDHTEAPSRQDIVDLSLHQYNGPSQTMRRRTYLTMKSSARPNSEQDPQVSLQLLGSSMLSPGLVVGVSESERRSWKEIWAA